MYFCVRAYVRLLPSVGQKDKHIRDLLAYLELLFIINK